MEEDRMTNAHKLIHHIETLKEKHDALDAQIKELYDHHTDNFKIEELKKKIN